ncbi:MAG: hypothetical protein JJU45_04235 [Acidimicrobiia bacterium]|nr:hypothetical protein [Acidimicrobiia bacterium]
MEESLGLAFETSEECYLVWPWDQVDAQQHLVPVAVVPGEWVTIFLAPMNNPAATVVEPCPGRPAGSTSSFEVPFPDDISAELADIVISLGSGVVSASDGEPVVDGTQVTARWQETWQSE